MLFNSFEYALFLPLVFFIYWFILKDKLKAQNLFLLAVSYLFYGWWDYRFLSLLFLSSLMDYFLGLKINSLQDPRKRKGMIVISLVTNLGLLGTFKYYNFFVDSFINSFAFFGLQMNASSLNVILPVGISFYTFQSLSYTIDIYKKNIEPAKDPVAFFAFVSFFPQLVAGPIERASNLLPQFYKKRIFDYENGKDGLRFILWGLFKKVMIADNCAVYVEQIFNSHETLPGSVLAMGAVYFALQIYCDFSGYTDIARGSAKLLGFELMKNFNYPYFSRDIAEFWRRWHISLSTWFKDYLYIPLGGSKGGTWEKLRNTMIVFIVSGLWHGANWTFVIWGFLNALFFVPLLLSGRNRAFLDNPAQGKLIPSFKEVVLMGITFSMVCMTWIFFRAENSTQAFSYFSHMFSGSLFTLPSTHTKYLPVLFLFLIFEWTQREKEIPLKFATLGRPVRWSIYYGIVLIIFNFGSFNQNSFIYFQF